jgi:MFS family permease
MNLLGNSEEFDEVQKKNLWALFIISLIYGFASKPFFIVYQPFLLEITDSVFMTGILVTLGGILLFLPKPWVGKLSDRFSRKKVWLLEMPFFYAGMTFLIFTENFLFLIPGIILFHLSGTFGELGYNMFISMSSEKTKKGILFGLMFFGIFFGDICGEFLVMLDLVQDIRVYFILYLLLDTINYLINIFMISDLRAIKSTDSQIIKENIHKKQNMWKEIFKSPKKRAVLIFFVLDLFIYGISTSILGAGLRAQYGLSLEQLAFIGMWLSISTMIFQIPGGHLADKIGKKRSLIVSELFGLGTYFCYIFVFILWSFGFQYFLIPLLSVANILNGITASTFIPSAQILSTDLDETRKAESFGILSFLKGIGFMPTGIIGGFLIEKVSYIVPFILSFIGIIFLIWFLSKYLHD